MRTIVLVSATTLAAGVLAYNLVLSDSRSVRSPSYFSSDNSMANVNVSDKLDGLMRSFGEYEKTNQEQVQRILTEQARLTATLQSLQAEQAELRLAQSEQEHSIEQLGQVGKRLNAIEQTGAEPNTFQSAWDGSQQLQQAYGENSSSEEAQSLTLTEADLGGWMTEVLRTEQWDATITTVAAEQAAESLRDLPDTNLDDIQCNERYCRANFTHVTGSEPDVSALFGKPPFLNEGFTVTEPNGSVSVYSTQEGVSIDDLRGEAKIGV